MAEPLDRDEVIGLLDRLGSDQDKDVLEAARALHARINAAGLDWDELLTADTSAEPIDTNDATESPTEPVDTSDAAESPAEPIDTNDAAESPPEPIDTSDAADTSVEPVETSDATESPAEPVDTSDATESPAGKTGKDGSTLDLIEELLAKSDRSETLREELEEYKADIADGEFHPKDHQYVRSLHARLTK